MFRVVVDEHVLGHRQKWAVYPCRGAEHDLQESGFVFVSAPFIVRGLRRGHNLFDTAAAAPDRRSFRLISCGNRPLTGQSNDKRR